MPSIKRLIPACTAFACAIGLAAAPAMASTTQQAIIQDNPALQANPVQALQNFQDLGVTTVKVAVYWNAFAPNPNSRKAPKGFTATNPASYPAKNWAWLDDVVKQAKADGLKVGFMVAGPAPKWAQAGGEPAGCKLCVWDPNAKDFGQFVKALGTRYNGKYKPKGTTAALPRVSWWSIWNEPNYGSSLAPQTVDNGTVDSAAYLYRGLLDAAWTNLEGTGHTTSSDTILFGETAPRGTAKNNVNSTAWTAYKPGVFGGTMPLIFLSQLYCVGQNGKRLTGTAAKAEQCPSSAGQFKSQNPALFQASGFAVHPYAQGTAPNLPTYATAPGRFGSNAKTKQSNPYYADFGAISRIETSLDKLQSVYGSSKKYSVWNTEFGYWTNPPDNTGLGKVEATTPANAAYYMNWAEYLSYRNPRIASYDQYMLIDAPGSSWNEGLLNSRGAHKPAWAAFQTPLYMPTTSASSGKALTVWGGVRPAALEVGSLRPEAELQFQAHGTGSYKTLKTIRITSSRGYFQVAQKFPTSGNVRIAWSTPATEPHASTGGAATGTTTGVSTTNTKTGTTTTPAVATQYSRVQKITIK